ncbi:YqcC family protein [Endozoicomonas ascidiicola]|uniref:YqcC family protein n=1 Tax=Endozoicomonas ascidiicola TaxID=1698521 RepID=UPI00082BF3B0|nr:YqcC family protein [Endozoicomonas ascidiicola]
MSQEIINLLEAIEDELRNQNVWAQMPPSIEALSSTTPFCMDTMHFSQWLQWIFIPRIRAILDAGGSLPTGSDMKPYAEEALPMERLSSQELLNLIEKFDQLMN